MEKGRSIISIPRQANLASMVGRQIAIHKGVEYAKVRHVKKEWQQPDVQVKSVKAP